MSYREGREGEALGYLAQGAIKTTDYVHNYVVDGLWPEMENI